MQKIKYLLLALIINKTISTEFLEEKGVSILSTNKFDEFLSQKKYSLILTYLPNCAHCKDVFKYLPSLTKKLKEIKVNVGKFNAESNNDYNTKINTNQFPDLRLYINDLFIEYPYQLEEDKIYNWVNNLVNKNFDLQPIKNQRELDRVLKKNLALIFKYDKKDLKTLELIKNFSVIYNTKVYIYEAKGLKNFKHDKDDYLFYLHRNFDDGAKSFTAGKEGFPAMILQKFMAMFSFPSMNKMGEKETQNIFKNKLKTLFVYDENYDSDLVKRVKKLALKYKGKLHFVMSNKKEVNAETLANLIAIEELPAVRILGFGNGTFLKYKPDDLTKASLTKFIENAIADKNEVFYKKEAIPKKQGFVKKVVRDNYKKIVLKSKKHVFVAFTTDWCEHCKEVDTAFSDVKKNILPEEKNTVIFAKANYSKNDFDIVIKSFPTIYLFKKGNKKNPIEYDLIRDWEVMLDFIGEKINKRLFTRVMPEEVKENQPKMPENGEQVEL